ncbi:MAG: ABC transporter permease, partial [Candidatus Latescibacteria bacterium]|nr:ABC transporter permease [Candidatus Latescibacterota bacterium]
ILPADYRYPIDQDLWTPLVLTTDQLADRSSRTIGAMALLSDISSKEEAHTVMTTIVSRIAESYPDTHKGWNVYIQSLREQMGDEITTAFSYTLFGAVIFVLLLACANVMNLQLARATGRRKEIAIRAALGANQWRVIRQLLIESLVLSGIAGSLGILVAYWGIDMIKPTLPQELHKYVPMWSHMGIDSRVLMFTTSIAVLTGIVSGLVPALQSARPNLNETLTDSSRGSSGGTRRSKLRSSLVVSEVAIALVLLVGASMMIQGFASFLNRDLGFEKENLLTMRITLPETKYNEPHLITSFYRQAYERLSVVPGVRSVGGANYLHADNSWDMVPTEIEGRAALSPTEAPRINRHIVSPGYLTALQISLVRGRLIAESDNMESQPVVVISESLANRHWPDGNPIGQRMKVDGKPSVDGSVPIGGPWRTVVGVVRDATYFWFDDRANATAYLPALQVPRLWMNVVLLTEGDPLATVSAARSQIADLDPQQAVAEIKTMERIISSRLAGVRLGAILMGVFSVMALVLAGVGIYSVMAYTVAQRTHEIGIRMAIGAGRKTVLTMILRQALVLASIGLAVGLPLSYGLASMVTGGIGLAMEFNSLTFVVFTVALVLIAVAASAIPAIRATRLDPMIALRYE